MKKLKNGLITKVKDKRLQLLIESIELPECLKRPLEFGNTEQINALRTVEEEIDGMEDKVEDIKYDNQSL